MKLTFLFTLSFARKDVHGNFRKSQIQTKRKLELNFCRQNSEDFSLQQNWIKQKKEEGHLSV